jgi:hypothetical protein
VIIERYHERIFRHQISVVLAVRICVYFGAIYRGYGNFRDAIVMVGRRISSPIEYRWSRTGITFETVRFVILMAGRQIIISRRLFVASIQTID